MFKVSHCLSELSLVIFFQQLLVDHQHLREIYNKDLIFFFRKEYGLNIEVIARRNERGRCEETLDVIKNDVAGLSCKEFRRSI